MLAHLDASLQVFDRTRCVLTAAELRVKTLLKELRNELLQHLAQFEDE